MSGKNAAKSLTTKYDKFEAERLSFTQLEDNERSKGQRIAYPRYNHPTLGENQPLLIQGPWMVLDNYGVPQIGEYYKEDKDRAFLKMPLNMEDKEVVKMVKELEKLDAKYDSEEFKTENFGAKAKKYKYQATVRTPEDEDAEVQRPRYMKLKLDLTWPECNVKTEVHKSELLDSGKRVREAVDIETVSDFASQVNYMSKIRPIFRPVKMWAHQKNMKDPAYGIVFKLVKIEVEPNKNSSSMYQSYLQGDVFLDDEEDETLETGEKEEAPTTVFKAEEKASKKLDSDSESDSDSSDESDSESEEVKAKPAAKGKGKGTKKVAG